jgi:hypothetical protein
MDGVNKNRSLAAVGGCARKTVSLPAETVHLVELYLGGVGAGMTFSGFVSEALSEKLKLLNIKRKTKNVER